jgi:hypothetical protein
MLSAADNPPYSSPEGGAMLKWLGNLIGLIV